MRLSTKLKHKMLMKSYDVTTKFLDMREPAVFIGKDASLQLCKSLSGYGITHLLMVTDADIVKLGLHQKCLNTLKASGLAVTVFDGIEPDPTQAQMEEGVNTLKRNHCNGVLGFGGGSSIDAGKLIAARSTNSIGIDKMEGGLKIKKQPLPIFAVPTTAGTGSEATIAAVASIKETNKKITVADPKIIPLATALDPLLTLSLPKGATASTGVDTLTHGLEGFFSTRVTPKIAFHCRAAIKMTFDHLENAYNNGEDVDAREGMLQAAYHGGLSIQHGVGYVHSIAHQLGAIYHIPHGLANAVVLMPILRFSKDAIIDKMAELAVLIGVGSEKESSDLLADRFMEKTEKLVASVDIPTTFDVIRQDRIKEIAQRAYDEALTLCAVPKYMDLPDLEKVIEKVAFG